MKLVRSPSDSSGTFGVLYNDNMKVLCFTVELPWLDNHPQTSCIPIGYYNVEKYNSPKHGDVWQIMNVPNRSNIEIHPANLASELLGCIGVGDTIGKIEGMPAVLNSQKTFKLLKCNLKNSGDWKLIKLKMVKWQSKCSKKAFRNHASAQTDITG